jgi:thiamine biosynthesis protein ThiI
MRGQKEIILLKLGESVLKGQNRRVFEQRLAANVKYRLSRIGKFEVYAIQSTIYIRPGDGVSGEQFESALDAMSSIYGVVYFCRAAECEKDLDTIMRLAPEYCASALEKAASFRAEAKRSDKAFPMTSPEIEGEVGYAVLQKFPGLKVNLKNPEVTVNVEIRDRAAYIHAGQFPGAGGLPVGTGGNGLLLLSGGIDSPVAGHMMAKRGVKLAAVHFESPPYTSLRARQKVLDLADAMSLRCGKIPLYIVPAAKIMEQIRNKCPNELFTLILRRFMMRIACGIADKEECGALITGESLGQVASQTMDAIAVTNAVCDRPVFRPCIGMDKEEIIRIARSTGTFDISIRPFEDCCTVFTPRHPKTKPKLEQLERAEERLDVGALVSEAIENAEFVMTGYAKNGEAYNEGR